MHFFFQIYLQETGLFYGVHGRGSTEPMTNAPTIDDSPMATMFWSKIADSLTGPMGPGRAPDVIPGLKDIIGAWTGANAAPAPITSYILKHPVGISNHTNP